mmetsp:Transcript_35567/g.85829  ORF Transcript_35567/g.85829 Transcript_35567/m.85829 type:complete len:301 (+) Transcript_35567:1957-2859(+)
MPWPINWPRAHTPPWPLLLLLPLTSWRPRPPWSPGSGIPSARPSRWILPPPAASPAPGWRGWVPPRPPPAAVAVASSSPRPPWPRRRRRRPLPRRPRPKLAAPTPPHFSAGASPSPRAIYPARPMTPAGTWRGCTPGRSSVAFPRPRRRRRHWRGIRGMRGASAGNRPPPARSCPLPTTIRGCSWRSGWPGHSPANPPARPRPSRRPDHHRRRFPRQTTAFDKRHPPRSSPPTCTGPAHEYETGPCCRYHRHCPPPSRIICDRPRSSSSDRDSRRAPPRYWRHRYQACRNDPPPRRTSRA